MWSVLWFCYFSTLTQSLTLVIHRHYLSILLTRKWMLSTVKNCNEGFNQYRFSQTLYIYIYVCHYVVTCVERFNIFDMQEKSNYKEKR